MSGPLVREAPYFKNPHVQALDDVLLTLALAGDDDASQLAQRLRLRLDRDKSAAEALSHADVAKIAQGLLDLVPNKTEWLAVHLQKLIQ